MGLYADWVLPRLIDKLMAGDEFAKQRREALQGVKGTVLEIGFGSGLNLPFYPSTVTRLLAVDPSLTGRKLARSRLAQVSFPVEFVGLDGESLDIGDHSVDAVVSTWTLCTIPNVAKALSEARRVLKKDGRLFFLEHGLSDEPNVAKWQDRLTPLQKTLVGGCHLNRDIKRLILDAGFSIEELSNYYMKGPKPGTYLFKGVARA